MTETGLCTYLEWDSEFFERRIARIESDTLDPESLAMIEKWCESNQIDCLYFLADPYDCETTHLAEDRGFHLVDIRTVLSSPVPPRIPLRDYAEDIEVRTAGQADLAALSKLAGEAYGIARFHYDPKIPKEKSDRFYALWTEKSCQEPDGRVWIAEDDGQPSGYLTSTLHRSEAEGHFDLMVVDPALQGRGVARAMVRAGLRWFEEQGVDRASFVTQGRNIACQRVFQRFGFETESIQLWYHRWFR